VGGWSRKKQNPRSGARGDRGERDKKQKRKAVRRGRLREKTSKKNRDEGKGKTKKGKES